MESVSQHVPVTLQHTFGRYHSYGALVMVSQMQNPPELVNVLKLTLSVVSFVEAQC